ncbi:MAG: class I SAM-dependent methyltransferase, partial [Chloroflexota bacterium]
ARESAGGGTVAALELAAEQPQGAVVACCSTLYGHPLAELLVGESFHPGGLSATRALLDAARAPRGAQLLDVGCGLGASARVAASEYGLRVEALDSSGAVIERARSRPGGDAIAWQTADLRELPYDDDSFDVVLAECVLSTAPRGRALAELARVLRPDGMLLVSDVQSRGRAIPGLDDHALLGAALCVNDAWSPGELERSVAAHGLVVRRRWDRSDDVLRLLERIEGRLLIAASVASRLQPALEIADGLGRLDVPEARVLAASVRAAVEAGELGYFAAIVRCSSAVSSGP